MFIQYFGIVFIGVLVTQTAAVLDSRVVNGTQAVNYQFPWHLSLTVSVINSTNLRYCGASIIGPHYALTAATCVLNADVIKVDVGSISFSNPLSTQNTSVLVIHPEFNAEYNLNNIAIIYLHEAVYYTNDKRAILLAGQSQVENTFQDTASYISGFGVWQNGVNYLSENLRFAQLTVITNDQCRTNFVPAYIQNETMCTMGYNNTLQSGCYGDTGGALVTNIHGTWYQIGVISTIHGGGCTGTYPNLHTKITSYLEWIHQMTSIPINP